MMESNRTPFDLTLVPSGVNNTNYTASAARIDTMEAVKRNIDEEYQNIIKSIKSATDACRYYQCIYVKHQINIQKLRDSGFIVQPVELTNGNTRPTTANYGMPAAEIGVQYKVRWD